MSAKDPITTEIIQNSLQAATDEMFAALRHTAMSPIIYEVLDMGTGIMDARGELAGSGAGIPAFIGMLDKSVKVIMAKYREPGEISEGDIFIVNDPYNGGVTHLNDVILSMPVFSGGEIIAWTANIAHWSDIGGMVPGSSSTDAKEIFQEGLILSGVKLFARGEVIRSVIEIITSNSRMPDFIKGDLWAGVASVRVGEKRIQEIVEKYGRNIFIEAIADYMDYGEKVSRRALAGLPKKRFAYEELQDDGQVFKAVMEIKDDEFVIDLTGSPDQDTGPFNMSRDVALVSCQIFFKGITSAEKACNAGSFRPLKMITRKGSVFDPRFPAANGVYYELAIRLHDFLCRAFADEFPESSPAGGFASVCGTFFGGTHPDTGRTYVVVEPEIGGWGGSPAKDGESGQFSAIHGETFNCPAEVAEARYGVAVDYLGFHDEPGGAGLHRGGKGVRIDYRMRSENGWLTIAYTRSKVRPWPLEGGKEGSRNHVLVVRTDGRQDDYSVVSGLPIGQGDIIRVLTATGAGWGDPKKRAPELVREDVSEGYITKAEALDDYGVKI